MKYTKCCIVLVTGLLALGPFLSAKNPSDAKTEQDRLQNAGTVMQEILKVPDDIPQDLLDKARCVVVMPSVLKAAFRCRRQLRPWHHDLPHRQGLHRSLGRAGHVCA